MDIVDYHVCRIFFMKTSSPDSALIRIASFWQRQGGLAFFGPLVLLLGFLGISTAAQRWMTYIVLGVFVLTQARRFIPIALRQSRILQLACIFILYSQLSLLWQDNFESSEALGSVRTGAVIFFCLGFLGWAIFVTDSRNMALMRAVRIFCFAAVLVATIAVALHLSEGLSTGRRLSVSGMTKNPVKAASVFSVVLITLIVWRGYFIDFVGRHGLAIMFLPIITLVVLTFSRGPLIGFITTATLALFFSEQKLIASILAATICLFALLVFSGVLDQLEIIKRADSHRFEIWADAFTKISQKPVFGWGIKDLTKFGVSSDLPGWKSPHNLYIGTVFYGGFVGLGLFASMLAMSYKTAIGSFKAGCVGPLALMLLTFGLILGFFNTRSVMVNMQSEWLIFWIPIGLLIGLELKNKGIKLESS